MRRTAVVTTVLVMLGLLPVAAQAVVLKYAPAKGQSSNYHDVIKLAMQTSFGGTEAADMGSGPMNMQMAYDATTAVKVLGVDDKGNYDVEVSIVSGTYSVNMETPGIEWGSGKDQGAVPKLRYQLKINPRGEVIGVKGGSSRSSGAMGMAQMFGMGEQENFFISYTHPLPNKEVSVGDKWTSKVKLPPTPARGGGEEAAPQYAVFTSKLVSLITLRGRQVAKIHTEGVIPMNLGEMFSAEDLEGGKTEAGGQVTVSSDWYYDYQQSLVVQDEGTMSIQVSVKATAPSEQGGGSFEMTMRGKANGKSTLTEKPN